MRKRILSEKMIRCFERTLREEEKSEATVGKYLHDVACFAAFAGGRPVNKALLLSYKEALQEKYAVTSANSILAALNSFLRFMGWTDCCVKQFNVQKRVFCSAEQEITKAEYRRLVQAAGQQGNERLRMILQTICATGIRVSELQFITVEAVRRGEVTVCCKRKSRGILIVRQLQKQLLRYIQSRGITAGCVFITRSGKPINRCNIWREMKALCARAGVSPKKVFPHNLRHLFARTFYGLDKDIAKLADILGHSSINTTRIYIISTGAEHRRCMEHMKLIL